MGRMMTLLLALTCHMVALAQNQDFERKYNLLVSQGGPAGVGVETVLDKWAEADPYNVNMLTARFNLFLTRAQSAEVISRPEKTYLGMEPVLCLKDSVYYYQVAVYDDALYGEAIAAIDHAISLHPGRLEFRFLKANALMSYEKESPDMTLSNLISLAEEFTEGDLRWTYDEKEADDEFFQKAMQEYCISFYTMSVPGTLEAFVRLSRSMLSHYPKNCDYIRNIGTYQLIVKKDYKAALKSYGKVLKLCPDDYAALKNSFIAARYMDDRKLMKKYQEQINALGAR